MRRLLDLSSALAEVASVDEICDAIARLGVDMMGATGGGVLLLCEGGEMLRTAGVVGYDGIPDLHTFAYPVDDTSPAAFSVQHGEALWIHSTDEWKEMFPGAPHSKMSATYQARASLPLVARGRAIGVLTFSFAEQRTFDSADRAFGLSLATQCAQAVDRALLLQSEQRARAAAERQRAHLESVFETAPARIALARGPDHVFEFANSAYLRYLDDRNIVGRRAGDVFPEALAQGIVAVADGVYATGTPTILDETPYWVDRDGDGVPEERYFNAAMLPWRDADGAIGGVMLYSVDVTDFVMSRRRVEQLAGRLEAILRQAAEGIIIVDAHGSIEFTNDLGSALLGAAGVGVPVREHAAVFHLCTPDGRVFATKDLPLLRSVEHGETLVDVPMLVRRPGEPDRYLEVSSSPVTAENGTLLGAVATFRDATAQHALQRQRDEFLAAVSHDLRTPLTSIKALAQLARRRTERFHAGEAARIADALVRIDETADKMNSLIGRLLDLMRMQANEPLMLTPKRFDLLDLLREAIAEAQVSTSIHDIRLLTDEHSLSGVWDGQRIERVFANLLSNAVKYTSAGGAIVVTALRTRAEPAPAAVITVQDPGIGIPVDALPHIFDRFYRAPNVGAVIPGAGLGLASVRQIVEQHSGTIDVRSREGLGTTVTVTLPLEMSEGGQDDGDRE
jgi:signal transduction histidine kinase